MALSGKFDASKGTGYERKIPLGKACVLMFAEAHSEGTGGATTVGWISCGWSTSSHDCGRILSPCAFLP